MCHFLGLWAFIVWIRFLYWSILITGAYHRLCIVGRKNRFRAWPGLRCLESPYHGLCFFLDDDNAPTLFADEGNARTVFFDDGIQKGV